jgi:hypothetical protein
MEGVEPVVVPGYRRRRGDDFVGNVPLDGKARVHHGVTKR